MFIEFLLESKNTTDIEIREVMIDIKFNEERSFTEILTEIRAIKGITTINIVNPSRMLSGDNIGVKNKVFFATIKIKIEIEHLGHNNYIKFINESVKNIRGVTAIRIKKKIMPQVDPRKAQEIKNFLTI